MYIHVQKQYHTQLGKPSYDQKIFHRGSSSVQIELRSDAPAKINIEIKPDKLPADGHSTADLLVMVTDYDFF